MNFLIFCIIVNAHALERQWIDPHDMNSKNIGKFKTKDFNSDTSEIFTEIASFQQCNYESTKQDKSLENLTLEYLKRVVNLILKSTTVDKNDARILNGKFVLNTEDDNYKFLTKFATYQEVDIQRLRQLDSILSSIFEKTATDHVFEFILTNQEKFSSLLFNLETLIIFGMFVALYIAYKLLQEQFSFCYVIKYFIIIIIIIDYGFKYKHLLEEADEENLKMLSPPCKQETGWWSYLSPSKDEKSCKKKVVTPLEVLLFQAKHIIIIPLSSLGTGMGILAKELWINLPFPWNIAIFPIMLIFIILLITMIMTVMNESPFKINLMHLFHVEFGGRHRDDRINDRLDRFFDEINHRPMVQSTRKSPDKKIRTNTTNKNHSSKKQSSFQEKNTQNKNVQVEDKKANSSKRQLKAVKQKMNNSTDSKSSDSEKIDNTVENKSVDLPDNVGDQ